MLPFTRVSASASGGTGAAPVRERCRIKGAKAPGPACREPHALHLKILIFERINKIFRASEILKTALTRRVPEVRITDLNETWGHV